jgi:surface polysaccharide O-acyltransferase-like enzyme
MSMGSRVAWVDAQRTLACAVVVLAHVNIYTRPSMTVWIPGGFVIAPLLSIAVPTFMFLSGYVGGTAVLSWSSVLRLSVPFLVWNAVMLALGAEGRSLTAAQASYFMLTGAAQLYFLFALLQLRALGHLVRRLDAGMVAAAAICLSALCYLLLDLQLWLDGADGGFMDIHARKTVFPWIGAFFLGRYVAAHPEILDRVWRYPSGSGLLVALLYLLMAVELAMQQEHFGYAVRGQFIGLGFPLQLFAPLALAAAIHAARHTAMVRALAALGWTTFGVYLAHNAILLTAFAALQSAGLANGGTWEVPMLFLVAGGGACALTVAARSARGPLATVLAAVVTGTAFSPSAPAQR